MQQLISHNCLQPIFQGQGVLTMTLQVAFSNGR